MQRYVLVDEYSANSLYKFNIKTHDEGSGFHIVGGQINIGAYSTGFHEKYFEFSGYDGYIFDADNKFVNGYALNEPIDLEVSVYEGIYSYKINNILIANNKLPEGDLTINSIYYSGSNSDDFNLYIEGFTGNYITPLYESGGNLLASSDNILLGATYS